MKCLPSPRSQGLLSNLPYEAEEPLLEPSEACATCFSRFPACSPIARSHLMPWRCDICWSSRLWIASTSNVGVYLPCSCIRKASPCKQSHVGLIKKNVYRITFQPRWISVGKASVLVNLDCQFGTKIHPGNPLGCVYKGVSRKTEPRRKDLPWKWIAPFHGLWLDGTKMRNWVEHQHSPLSASWL